MQSQKQTIANSVQLDTKLTTLNEKLIKTIQQANDVKDVMRKYRQKSVGLPESTYCMSNGGFLVKLHSKEMYPFLENRLQALTRDKKSLKGQVDAVCGQIVSALKAKQVHWVELEKESQKLVEEYMDLMADDD